MDYPIEHWTISREDLPYDFRVEVVKDLDGRPDDFDCYSEDDVAAWKRDDWEYIIVTVTPVSGEVAYEGAAQSLGGVEYGFFAGRWLDRKELEQYPLPDLIKEATHEADEIQARMVNAMTVSV